MKECKFFIRSFPIFESMNEISVLAFLFVDTITNPQFMEIPVRREIDPGSKYFLSDETKRIKVNCLEISFANPDARIFHYDVKIEPNVPHHMLR